MYIMGVLGGVIKREKNRQLIHFHSSIHLFYPSINALPLKLQPEKMLSPERIKIATRKKFISI